MPLEYFQGVTSDRRGHFYFDGLFTGLYRTDLNLVEQARSEFNVIPPDVGQREGYNHIGDLTWDRREHGRLLLPLECFFPFIGNFCKTGSIGVADPDTLTWRYYVKLDPAYIDKVMFGEVSPNGRLLLDVQRRPERRPRPARVRRVADHRRECRARRSAAEAGELLPNAVPPSGITGAVFFKNRLLVAGANGTNFQVWSIDLRDGSRTLVIAKKILGESEGLDIRQGARRKAPLADHAAGNRRHRRPTATSATARSCTSRSSTAARRTATARSRRPSRPGSSPRPAPWGVPCIARLVVASPPRDTATAMSEENENFEVVRDFHDALNRRDVDAMVAVGIRTRSSDRSCRPWTVRFTKATTDYELGSTPSLRTGKSSKPTTTSFATLEIGCFPSGTGTPVDEPAASYLMSTQRLGSCGCEKARSSGGKPSLIARRPSKPRACRSKTLTPTLDRRCSDPGIAAEDVLEAIWF